VDKLMKEHRMMYDDFEVIDFVDPKVTQSLRDQIDVDCPMELHWTWNYGHEVEELKSLYEKGKVNQWNAETDLDWSIPVSKDEWLANPESSLLAQLTKLMGKDEATQKAAMFDEYAYTLSQLLHGEQAALQLCGQLTNVCEHMDEKFYAASQVADEARHVEVFARYIDEKLDGGYQVNAHLRMLLDDIISDSRWDMTYLGMQVMVEGLAPAAFGFMHQMTEVTLLKKLLRYVMSDEARHVAFGILSLQEYYEGLDAREIRDRQEFAFAAVDQMRKRSVTTELWDNVGVDGEWVLDQILARREQREMQGILFSKIVPNCKKLGLLDVGDGWLRERFGEIGILKYEDHSIGPEDMPLPVLDD